MADGGLRTGWQFSARGQHLVAHSVEFFEFLPDGHRLVFRRVLECRLPVSFRLADHDAADDAVCLVWGTVVIDAVGPERVFDH
ncbi:MAG: hypothetical protein ACI8VE_000682 [Natrialbaceae archaeon]